MYIYKTTNLVNYRVYIGKSEKSYNPDYYGSGLLLKRAINKYGKENFKNELVEECDDIEELNSKEKYWINFYSKNSYNLAEGGDGGWTTKHFNEDQKKRYREKLSKAQKGRTVSEETRKIISDKNSGKFYGDKDKISKTIKKLWLNPNSIYNNEEYRKKLSESGKKRKWSEETKEKIRLSKLGSKNPSAQKVIVDDKIYDTITVCANEYGISNTAVRKRCKSRNFIGWSYID